MRRTICLVLIISYAVNFGPLSCAKSRKGIAPDQEVARKETPFAEKVSTEETVTLPVHAEMPTLKYKEVRKTVLLQEATVVPIELKETWSSETAKQGDRITFEVLSDITVEE